MTNPNGRPSCAVVAIHAFPMTPGIAAPTVAKRHASCGIWGKKPWSKPSSHHLLMVMAQRDSPSVRIPPVKRAARESRLGEEEQAAGWRQDPRPYEGEEFDEVQAVVKTRLEDGRVILRRGAPRATSRKSTFTVRISGVTRLDGLSHLGGIDTGIIGHPGIAALEIVR